MAMRLLPKSEVVKAKALETQREVEQGKRLATKVDNLRQLQAETEEGLEKWRSQTLEAIQSEINAKVEELDSLKTQVTSQREKWREMFAPLDRQFALYVKTERGEIEQLQNTLVHHTDTLHAEKEQQQEREQELDNRERALKKRISDLQKQKNEVERLEQEVLETVATARNEAQVIRTKAEAHEHETLTLRVEAAEQKKQLELKAYRLKKLEAELEKRETAIIIKELEHYSPIRK